MSPALENWKTSGETMPFGPLEHQVFVLRIGSDQATADRTLLLLHGFPESSYSFHKVIQRLRTRFDRIILFDMLGYGHSDKPIDYSYSLFEQADTALSVWQHWGITGGHLLAHDMGDSVATEILARRELGLLPAWLSDGLLSVTFTNGSIVLDLAQLRITQKLLLSRFGSLMNRITGYRIFCQQVRSAHGNDHLSEEDLSLLWEANSLQRGHRKTYLTIKYLQDRRRFETSRWLPALAHTDLPIHLCWGKDDAVAKVEMAHYLQRNVCQSARLSVMPNVGHFCQLDRPEIWAEQVLGFYESLA